MASAQTKRCIACAEEIQAAALLCRHCSTDQRDKRFLPESTEEPTTNVPEEKYQNPNGPQLEATEPLLPNSANSVQSGETSESASPDGVIVHIKCRICGQDNFSSATHCSNCEWSLGRAGVFDFGNVAEKSSREHESQKATSSSETQNQKKDQSRKQNEESNFFTEAPRGKSAPSGTLSAWVVGGLIFVLIVIFFGNSGIGFSGSYPQTERGLNQAASDCATQVIKANQNSVQSPDPTIQDSLIEQVARCIVQKNPGYKCSFGPDPVCVWKPEMVEGPRVMYIDSVYEKFKDAGSPYFQNFGSSESGGETSNGEDNGVSANSQQIDSFDNAPADEPASSESPSPAPVIWVPTVENIKACSLDYNNDTCPHDYSNYVVESKNKFGVNAQELVQRMISAGLCKEWPKENRVWGKPTIENACRGERDSFYVATGDAEIWGLIYIHPYGEGYAAGDGWVVYAVYTSLEDMQIVADLLGGIAWQRGF